MISDGSCVYTQIVSKCRRSHHFSNHSFLFSLHNLLKQVKLRIYTCETRYSFITLAHPYENSTKVRVFYNAKWKLHTSSK